MRLIGQSHKKTDRIDAESLARLARMHLMILRSRDCLVASRTRQVNHVRHEVKVWGERIPSFSTPAFAKKARAHIPEDLKAALNPILDQIETHTQMIREYDKMVKHL